MNPIWKFPPTGGGNISGLNETGITQFKSLPTQSVTKETIQDSLDANAIKNKPSIIKFSVFSVSRNKIPDIDGLTNIFQLGKKYWSNHSQSEAEEFFTNGIEVLQKNKINVMAIQDYNTTGLSNISGNNSGGWVALVRSTGITEKGPDASGSFGIGKHAPFAASQLQTILYGTLNEDDEIGFQGVSKIASFQDDNDETTQGTGYFGYAEKNNFKPVVNPLQIPKPFRRSERGTDKFIIGLVDNPDWEIQVLTEAVSSYMLAILNEKLEVHIGEFILTKDTLADAIEKIEIHNPKDLSIQFYQALTSPETKEIAGVFETDEGKEEVIQLNLLVAEGFRKRIVLYRGTGMKIYDRGHFRTPIEFAGVLVVKGERLNAILRKMEPPTHDKWDPNLFKENIPYARKLIKQITDWLHAETRNLIDVSNIDSVELTGLENLLPDVTEKESAFIELEKKQIQKNTSKVKRRRKRKRKQPKKSIITGNEPEGIIPSTPIPNDKTDQPDPSPEDDPTTDPEPGPEPKPESDPKKKQSKAKISLARVFSTDSSSGIYSIRFWPTTDGIGTFSLKSMGENNNLLEVDIMNAKLHSGVSIPTTPDSIGPIDFIANEMLEIKVQLKTQNKLALEVIST